MRNVFAVPDILRHALPRVFGMTSAQDNRKAGLRGEADGRPGPGSADNGRSREISRAEIDEVIEAHGGWSAALVTNIEPLSS